MCKKLKLNIQLFGGSLSVTGTEVNVSVENNQSYIDVVIRPSTNSTTYNQTGSAYVQGTVVGQHNSYNIPRTYFKIGYGSTVTAYSGRIGPFNHNTDGSLDPVTINVQCYIVQNTQPSKSINVTMSTIPRASAITVNDANIGSGTSIMINKASDSFTTTLKYRVVGESNWREPAIVIKSNFKEVYPWTVPTSLYAEIPDSKTIRCEFQATTYSDDTQVGNPTTTTATFTATGNPIINDFTLVDINSTTTALTGDSSKMIRYASNVRAIISASGQNSARISSIVVNGVIASNGIATFPNASTNSYNVTVTDSRGYTTTQTKTITMVDYVPLTLNATIKRHTPVDGKIDISFNGNYFNSSFGSQSNTLTIQYRSIEKGGSWENVQWNNLTSTLNNNAYSGTEQLSNYDYTKQYEFQIRAVDKVQTKTIEGISIAKGQPIFNWRDGYFNVNGEYYKNGSPLSNSYLPISGGTISGNLKVNDYTETDLRAINKNDMSSIVDTLSFGHVRFLYNVSGGTSYLFDHTNNANAILQLNKHQGDYDSQLGFSSNGNIYYKNCNYESLASKSWKKIAFMDDMPSTTTGTFTISKTSGAGNISSAIYYKYGNVITLYISFSTSGSTSAGSNVFVGTVSGVDLPPVSGNGVGFHGASAFIAALSSNGGLAIRVVGATDSASSGDMTISITYVIS